MEFVIRIPHLSNIPFTILDLAAGDIFQPKTSSKLKLKTDARHVFARENLSHLFARQNPGMD